MSYYNQIASGYEELHKEEQEKKIAIIKKHITFHENWKILDVGCGPYFSEKDDFKGKVIGIDPAFQLLKIAQKRIAVVQGKGELLPFKDNTFMAVVSVTALQNFTNIKKGLEEIKRVAKEYIVISVLKKSAKIEMIKRLIPEILTLEKIIEEEKDLIFFSKKF